MSNEAVIDPVHEEGPSSSGRRRFLTATTAVVGAVGVAGAAVPFIKSWNPSARAQLAGAPVTVDISALQEGQRLIAEWRGQPIWIVKRSKAILEALPTLDSHLRDPMSENLDQQPAYVREANPELRSLKTDISVLVGLCTHLGCSPEMVAEIRPAPFDPDWKGGYFCPCHKSKFDMAGRVYQGVPAPINLLVPPHYYADDNTLVIGVDPSAGKGGA
ncbi:ubiquinol-cytochrome c reductase iron-sulfur subunit [Luteimonas sp. RIT-PG2_3]